MDRDPFDVQRCETVAHGNHGARRGQIQRGRRSPLSKNGIGRRDKTENECERDDYGKNTVGQTGTSSAKGTDYHGLILPHIKFLKDKNGGTLFRI